jgi:hypothetical protein
MQNLQHALDKYRTIAIFLVLLALVTVIFGAIFGTGHQIIRGDANDPQIEVTTQVADILSQGVPPEAILGNAEMVDMGTSNAVFVMIFDKDHQVVGSSAQLDGQTPTPPNEAFEAANNAGSGDHRFTWEPKEGVRIAAVLKKVDDNNYVLAGRSLAETDARIQTLAYCTLIGWAIAVVFAVLLAFLLKPRQPVAIIEETNITLVE